MNNCKLMENENNFSHFITKNSERPLIRPDELTTYRGNHVDNNNILQEISKKYILIPRIYSINRYPVEDIKHSEDCDWKSKYNILYELKKEERAEPPERDTNEILIHENSRISNSNKSICNKNSQSTLPQEKVGSNISLPKESISSNYEVQGDFTNLLPHNIDLKADFKTDENTNKENDYKLLDGNKHIENINTEDNCIMKQEQANINAKVPKSFSSDNQNDSTKTHATYLPEIAQDDEKQHVPESYYSIKENKENDIVKHITDNNEASKNLSEFENNQTDGVQNGKEQQEIFYSENLIQNKENNEVQQDEILEKYINNHDNYYEELELSQLHHKPLIDNVRQESQEIIENRIKNHEQEHVVSLENQFNSNYDSQNYGTYEAHNDYTIENQNYEYQNVDQENPEYNSSNNHRIPPEPVQETQESLNEDEQLYGMHKNDIEFDQQQIYIDPSHNEFQQPYINNNEVITENNSSESVQETTNQQEIYDLQHEYITQNDGETEQQIDVNYSNVQNENDNSQHNYDEQNFNEIYQDNQGVQNTVYDYATQGQDNQQHVGYNEQSQSEYEHYVENNGLNAQNVDGNLQEDYGGQNIQGIYQEGNLQVQGVGDNMQYDYSPQNNESQNDSIIDPTVIQ